MAKTEEELRDLTERVASLAVELRELSEGELDQIAGGDYKARTMIKYKTGKPPKAFDTMKAGKTDAAPQFGMG